MRGISRAEEVKLLALGGLVLGGLVNCRLD